MNNLFPESERSHGPPVNAISDLKAYAVSVALGNEGWKMLDGGSLTEWPHLDKELRLYLDKAWFELSQDDKTCISNGGYQKISKQDRVLYSNALNELRILAAYLWIKDWRSDGSLICPELEYVERNGEMVPKVFPLWPDGFPNWPVAISKKLWFNMQLRAHYSREIRKLM